MCILYYKPQTVYDRFYYFASYIIIKISYSHTSSNELGKLEKRKKECHYNIMNVRQQSPDTNNSGMYHEDKTRVCLFVYWYLSIFLILYIYNRIYIITGTFLLCYIIHVQKYTDVVLSQ